MSAQRTSPRLRKMGGSKKLTPKLDIPLKQSAKSATVLNPAIIFLSPVLKALSKLIPPYFKNSWRELRQVTWPSRSETWKLTSAVFVFAIVFGAAILVVDKGLDEIFKKVVLK